MILDAVDSVVPSDPSQRLVTALVLATVGVPGLIYSLFVLGGCPIAMWMYVGQLGGLVVLAASLCSLASAYFLATDATDRADESDTGRAEQRSATESDAADPVEVLKRRYATGEIDESEFEQRVQRLVETDTSDGTPRNEREPLRE
jgi:uncharacterized membrane protein